MNHEPKILGANGKSVKFTYVPFPAIIGAALAAAAWDVKTQNFQSTGK